MEKRIFTLESAADLEGAFPLMKELRPHLEFSEYIEIYKEAKKTDDYQIVAVEVAGQMVGLEGLLPTLKK